MSDNAVNGRYHVYLLFLPRLCLVVRNMLWLSSPQRSPVVQLNVGGHLFSTTLGSLRKHQDSKLAELFGSAAKVCTDAQGRFFIDRDGSHFGAVLEFLRSERLPTENIREVWAHLTLTPNKQTRALLNHFITCVWAQVYKEAVHYDIKPLIKGLQETPELFGELVGRQQFLSRVPQYKENIEVSYPVFSGFTIPSSQSRHPVSRLFILYLNSRRKVVTSPPLQQIRGRKVLNPLLANYFLTLYFKLWNFTR